ncbi:hypothetical protein B296_00049493 [Ensete ventricosum]|uniref:Cation-transporting P-type ATPase N-terminal domain-containing protein n=1 Tax=Ensete ventricosum TaxID=4639 RepID=A0A426YQD9_ENSVE|nr:hypothetical protein B296_00049493 [Ensete ventricosum]
MEAVLKEAVDLVTLWSPSSCFYSSCELVMMVVDVGRRTYLWRRCSRICGAGGRASRPSRRSSGSKFSAPTSSRRRRSVLSLSLSVLLCFLPILCPCVVGDFWGGFLSRFLGAASAGEQGPQVLGIHVEPAFLGHGGRRHHGHRPRQRRGLLLSYLLIRLLLLLLSLLDAARVNSVEQGKPPDWQDFVGIITLLLINSTISFFEENNAGNAAAALMARLAPKAKVLNVALSCFSL